MISHFNIGTNNIEAAEAFYSELLKLVNGALLFKNERMLFFGFGEQSAKLAVNLPHDGQPATVGNGCMVALAGTGREHVDAVYAKAIELGGTCEGAPGERLGGAVYGAYFRDLDGNKFTVMFVPGR